MRHTTLRTVMDWVAGPLGLDASMHEERIVAHVHEIRSLLYALFPEVPIEARMVRCVQPQRFEQPCGESGCRDWWGLVLPEDCEQVLAVRRAGETAVNWSGWQSPRGECFCEFAKVDVFDQLPVRRLPCKPVQWGFKADRCDGAVEMGVVYVDPAGLRREETLMATAEGFVETTYPVAEMHAVTLAEHAGEVVVQAAGQELARYQRHEVAPSYRRVRLNGLQCACPPEVEIVYAKLLVPVTRGLDLVEVDNAMVWKHLAHYVRINSRTSVDRKERLEAEVHYAKALELLKGMHRRTWGADQVTVDVARTFRRRSGLVGKGFCGVRRYVR